MSKQEYRIGTGSTTLLMIFVVLCLTTLGILSLVSARVDMKQTTRNIEMTHGYYMASSKAEELLFQIDQTLHALAAHAMDQDEYLAKIENELHLDAQDFLVEDEYIYFSIDALDDRVLDVTIALTPFNTKGSRYTITQYQLIDNQTWGDEDTFLNLLQEDS